MYIAHASYKKLLPLAVLLASVFSFAQAKKSGTSAPEPSRVDFYAGYGYLKPINTSINNQTFNAIYNKNVQLSLAYYLTRHWGIQAEIGYFSADSPRGAFGQCVGGACSSRDQSNYTLQGGPVLRTQVGRWAPFAHVLAGGSRTRGPFLQPLTWGYGVSAGGGVDYVLPWLNNFFALRPVQADFQYSHVNYGPTPSPALANYTGTLNMPAIKLSAGVVARFGSVEDPLSVSETCEVSPSSIYPGDPIKVEPATLNLNPKKKAVYTWSSSGGKLTVAGDGATIDTANLAPGQYEVKGHVSQGNKIYQQANCSSVFTVKSFDPPVMNACSANPASIKVGETSVITASATSPQNRALTYSFNSSTGLVSPQGNTATLSGANQPGTVTVTCNVVDDLGKTATATATVRVVAPPVPPAPQPRSLCSVSFERDRRHPVRVDNEAKACLDDIALALGRESSATLVIVGNYDSKESSDAGAERTLNIKQYLTADKGVEASRIQLLKGANSGKTADTILLPPGATNPAAGAQSFDPATIRPHGEPYGRKKTATTRRRR